MLKHNARWAAKLAKKQERQKQREEQRRAEEKRLEEERSKNPFALGGGAGGGSGLFGSGSLFDAPAAAPAPAPPADQPSSDEDDYNEEERMAEELAVKASLAEQRTNLSAEASWAASASCYQPALYLDTIPEPVEQEEPTPQAPAAPAAQLASGEAEAYEKMVLRGVDSVFERFLRRLGTEARQVVRYEYDGVPLPFSAQGALYKRLWPAPEHRYTPEVPPCSRCGAPRVFELQLMPNLVNLLRPTGLQGAAPPAESNGDAEALRRAEVERVLALQSGKDPMATDDAPTGLLWSTALIFVCSKDCCDGSEAWADEWVGLQYEGDL